MPIKTVRKYVECVECKNDLLEEVTLQKFDALRSRGGGPANPAVPADPSDARDQWSAYRCVKCGLLQPWSRYYNHTEVRSRHTEMTRRLRDFHRNNRVPADMREKLDSLFDAKRALSGLPGEARSFEDTINAAVAPLVERIDQLESELARRKGGRPRGSKDKKPRRTPRQTKTPAATDPAS